MAIELVTGHAGTDHVSSADMGRYHAGVCGPGKYVLATGQQFAATIASANLIRVASGDAVNQGRHITIPQNTYEEAAITNGTQGKARIDVIALRYTKTTQEVEGAVVSTETVALAVIKGTEVSNGITPEAPSINDGDIFDGAVIDDMPLYHVLITDTSITSVTPVFEVLGGLKALAGSVDDVAGDVDDVADDVTALAGRMTDAEGNITTLQTKVNSLMTRVDIACGAHTCAANTGTVNFDIDISSQIPTGYHPFDVRCGTTQNYEFYCWSCDFVSGSNNETVAVRIQKRSGTGGTIYPWICVTCVKE